MDGTSFLGNSLIGKTVEFVLARGLELLMYHRYRTHIYQLALYLGVLPFIRR
jgi:hypothetical protein